jgi:hypothetical protein
MSMSDLFKECFDDCGYSEAVGIFADDITEDFSSPLSIGINFVDGSTFRYYI